MMRNQTQNDGLNKNSTLDTNTPETSATPRPSIDHSDVKGQRPSLQHYDREFRPRRNMIPKRHPMFPMNSQPRMMPPSARQANRIQSPNVMFRGRTPNMMPGRNMFQGPGAQMGMPPPGSFMAPMQHRPKESENMQRDFMKPPNDGDRRISSFTQRQEKMPKDTRGFQGKMMDFQGKRTRGFAGKMMDFQGKQPGPFLNDSHPISGQAKTDGPMRKQSGPIGMDGGPMGMHGGPMGKQSGPMGMHGGPMGMHGGPMGKQSGPMGMHGGPMGMQGGPMGKPSGPMGMDGGPMGMHDGPMGKQSGPMGMHGGPMGMHGEPMGKPSGPMGMDGALMGMHDGPMGKQSGPMGVHGGPMGMHGGPIGKPSGPMGMDGGPMGMHDGPMGKQCGPVGMNGGLMGKPSGPMGMHGGPMGMQGGPIGKPSGPMGMDGGPMGMHDGPMGKQSGPMGMHGGPMGKPGGPMGMHGGPMGMQGGPMGKPSGPMGMHGGPMGMHGVPMGKPSGPMGIPGGPMGMHGAPMGKPSGPMVMHVGPMGMIDGLMGKQSGPMGMHSFPMGMHGVPMEIHGGPMGMIGGPMRMHGGPMGMHGGPMGMNKAYGQQGKNMGRFRRSPGQHMMAMPLNYKRMIRFPERYMDLSGYTMDFKGRFMNRQGKHVNPLNCARIHQGRAMMPALQPIKRRFMQKPERYMDMSRYTMDFEGRYRDRYGQQIDPMEQFNANIGRYIRNLPPSHKRMARFPERYIDLSRYTMDFQGRFMDNHGRHVDPFGRFHGNYGKVLMSPPLNQRRFTRQPEKYMDMSAYTMDFQGRFLDRRGRPVDLLGQHHRHPGRFTSPGSHMHQGMPMMPPRFATGPPFKHMDMSRYTMDFQGRLMDNQGHYVDHMRRFGDHMGPHPLYEQRNLMEFSRYPMDFQDRLFDKYHGPFDRVDKPNTFFESRGSPERGPSPGFGTNLHMEPRPIMQEKEYTELKSSPGFNRASPEFNRPRSSEEYGLHQENVSSDPLDVEPHMLPPMEDEHMQMPFMKSPMFPAMHGSMHRSIYSSEKPNMHYPTSEDDPQMQQHMMHFDDEMYMPMQKPFADEMMMLMMMMEMPNSGYQQYHSMEDAFMSPESEYMMDDRQWHSDDGFEYMDDEFPYEYGRMPNMTTASMHGPSSFRVDNEPREQSHLPPVIGTGDGGEIGRDERCDSRMDNKHMHSMEDREFDSRHGRFEHHEDMDYPGRMQDMHQRPISGFFDHFDYDDMFDDDYYMDYNMEEDAYPKISMAYPSRGFMNDFQMPFSFDPEYMGMQSGFMHDADYHPYPFMNDYFGYGYDDEDEADERERVEEEEEGRRRDISVKRRGSHSLHRIPYQGTMGSRQGAEDIAAGVHRRMSIPRIVLTEEKLVDDKHARYLEDAAEYLKERGRYLRDQHDRFVQELEDAGPLNHPQVQAEAEAHANEVEQEVNATEAEAEAVERLARTARRLSNVDHQRVLSGNRHPPSSA